MSTAISLRLLLPLATATSPLSSSSPSSFYSSSDSFSKSLKTPNPNLNNIHYASSYSSPHSHSQLTCFLGRKRTSISSRYMVYLSIFQSHAYILNLALYSSLALQLNLRVLSFPFYYWVLFLSRSFQLLLLVVLILWNNKPSGLWSGEMCVQDEDGSRTFWCLEMAFCHLRFISLGFLFLISYRFSLQIPFFFVNCVPLDEQAYFRIALCKDP